MITECPVCSSADVYGFLDVPQVPVINNILWLTRESAILARRADIQLAFCSKCGHIFNRSFRTVLMNCAQEYENSLHFSPRFQTFAESLAKKLVERYDLFGKKIIDIGCGQGDFLRLLCELGDNQGVGFDPSYRHEGEHLNNSHHVKIIQDNYSEKYRDYHADFICSRHVLEHISKPQNLVNNLRTSALNEDSLFIYFEVPNVMYTLRGLGIWDIIYEHPSFFSMSSFGYLFSNCGFKILDLYEGYQGQFLSVEAQLVNDGTSLLTKNANGVDVVAKAVDGFARDYHKKIAYWRNVLRDLTKVGKRVVVWGAGSKGVSFLNLLNNHYPIEYVVDINPRKRGMYVSGTGQEIVAPGFLQDYRPDIIIVMNSIYKDEISSIVSKLSLNPNFLYA